MNGQDKYEELENQIKQAATVRQKIDFLTVMVCMLAKNDVFHLWRWVKILIILGVLNLLSSQVDLMAVIQVLTKGL